eukprot:CAMPEP_0173391054 /NCGR_PEP_ID=MMETSP1356-20130122/17115_1 /TAXON_ID=77927 ORGANISM="Hemiselmis virescens, Strain PCC157" /NCGR_SAMPLE_ID=MMETSP1356 /ASSEMBLY_ACC=CAM_ASM_000847 /LENGTH=322 /DNA_ID=CAMNT_0014348587 /DNA_START=16 /DNA_END=984 /DNA_ORIENTATION=+
MANRGTFVVLAALAVAIAVVSAETVIYGKKATPNCDTKGSCTVALGSAGTVKLPALVAFKSAHGHYLSSSPPDGGRLTFSDKVAHWEEWDLVTVGDKVALQSHHGTWLSMAYHPADGFALAAERLAHELFTMEEKNSKASFKGNNGMWMSAQPDSLRQEFAALDWEKWMVEKRPSGKVALKNVHGGYLAASAPDTHGKLTQQEDVNEWETFVIDQVDRHQLTIETSHSTFLGAHADEWHPEKLIASEEANQWEYWKPFVNATNGKVCMQGHDGRFIYANENVWDGWGLAKHCMEHEQLDVVVVTEKMLADNKRAAEAKKAAK